MANARMLIKAVTACRECPYFQWEPKLYISYCSRTHGDLINLDTIPDWCPLPEATEAK